MRVRHALRRCLVVCLGLAALTVALCAGLRLRADSVARGYWRLDPAALRPLADEVAAAVEAGVDPSQFSTGSDRFDGEWALVTCQMAVIGLGQLSLREPELAPRYEGALRGCARWLMAPASRAFGTVAWGEDGLDPSVLDSDHGHAYLGWTNVALALASKLLDDRALRDTHRALTAALARRLSTLPLHRLETYPGETYPADLVMVAASVGLSGGYEAELARWSDKFRRAAIDADSGLVYQALSPVDGRPVDLPRGSSTALAGAFLQYVDPALARQTAGSLRRALATNTLGLKAVREVRPGDPFRMDIDSGPVIFGNGVSATGFGIAAARVAGDEAWFVGLCRTAHLFGVPRPGRGRWYLTGGTLGNAILLAMFSTGPLPEEAPRSRNGL